jgi:hypothetical protein
MVAVQEITERALFDHAPILRPSAPRAKPCTVTGGQSDADHHSGRGWLFGA